MHARTGFLKANQGKKSLLTGLGNKASGPGLRVAGINTGNSLQGAKPGGLNLSMAQSRPPQ